MLFRSVSQSRYQAVVTDKRVVDGENIVTCSVVAKDEQGDVKVSGSFDAALPSKA